MEPIISACGDDGAYRLSAGRHCNYHGDMRRAPDMIVMGSLGVMINFLPAARLGDPTVHGGVIILGSFTCIIGEIGMPSPGAADQEE